MKPHIIDDLDFVKTSYNSMRGEISSDWKNSDDQFEWNITIPPNTTVTVYLPTITPNSIFEIGSGTYHF